jgi:hypothetical protein
MRRFQTVATESRVATTVRLYLCREMVETLLGGALGSKSVVVIGAGKNTWPLTREKRLARQLRRRGHEVILSQTE